MKTFVPAVSFTAYPDGNHKNPVRFVKGVESDPLPDEFVALMHEQGRVSDEGPKRAVGTLQAPSSAAAKKFAAAAAPKPRRTGRAPRRST